MEIGKLPMAIVGITIAVIVCAVVLIPVVQESTITEDKFVNTGLYYVTNPTEETTVEFLGGTDWTINGEPLDYTIVGASNILIFDDIFVRNNGQVRGSLSQTWSAASLTINNGTVTGTATVGGNSTSISWTYSESFIATNDEQADFIMKSNIESSYIKKDSEIVGMGLSNIKDSSGNNNATVFYVTVENLTPVVTTPNTNVTVSNVQVNATSVDGYIDLYKFTSVTFTATWGTYDTDVTYNIVIVPHEVIAERSVHPDQTTIQLLNVIPLLVIIGIVMLAVGTMIYYRR